MGITLNLSYQMVQNLLGQHSFQFDDRPTPVAPAGTDLTFFDPGLGVCQLRNRLRAKYQKDERLDSIDCGVIEPSMQMPDRRVNERCDPTFRHLRWEHVSGKQPLCYADAAQKAQKTFEGWQVASSRSAILGLYLATILANRKMYEEKVYAVERPPEEKHALAVGFLTQGILPGLSQTSLRIRSTPFFPETDASWVDEMPLRNFPLILERVVS